MTGSEPNAAPPREAVIPRATYRVQLNSGFTFKDATAIVPYLAELGISHVYCSPYFRARAGSNHGYDVVDHNSFNPEIGDRADFERFVAALRAHDMGHVLDIVPNHVGIMGADNAAWMDVLENGQASKYAEFFDIDWSSRQPGAHRQGAGARVGRRLRGRARERGNRVAIRAGARLVLGVLSRASAARGPAHLPASARPCAGSHIEHGA